MSLDGLYGPDPVNPPVTQTGGEGGKTEEPGPDLAIAAATGQAQGNATVNVFFRPGPAGGAPGGPDEIAALVFSIDYDETKLSFDPSDANGDGIPDAIIPSGPAAFEMTVLVDPGRLNFRDRGSGWSSEHPSARESVEPYLCQPGRRAGDSDRSTCGSEYRRQPGPWPCTGSDRVGQGFRFPPARSGRSRRHQALSTRCLSRA